jgi:hypothetical protein
MKRFWLSLILLGCLLVPALANAFETGVASSSKELVLARIKCQQFMDDKNSTLNPGSDMWGGALAFCVCARDRSKIIWVWDVYKWRDQDGTVIAWCRRNAESRCGGCAKEPSFDLIEPTQR